MENQIPKYNESVTKWLETTKKELRPYYIGLDWEGSDLDEQVELESKNLDKFVSKIYNAVVLKDKAILLEIYPYFANLSNNRRTAFLFKEFSGVNPGRTNKEGIKAFNDFFGMEIENIIKDKEKQKQEAEQREKDDNANKELEKLKEYFSNPIWDITKLSNLQIGKLKSYLDVQYRFNGVVMTLKAYIEKANPFAKEVQNNMYKWNRRKSNGMTGEEQRKYEQKLLNGRNYNIKYESYTYEINKTIYDALALPDVTDYENLSVA